MEIFKRKIVSITKYDLNDKKPYSSIVFCSSEYKNKLFTKDEFEKLGLLLTLDDLENHKRICENVPDIEPYINFETLHKARVIITEPAASPVGISYNLNKTIWSELWKF